jgi:uncharacterized membrane protein
LADTPKPSSIVGSVITWDILRNVVLIITAIIGVLVYIETSQAAQDSEIQAWSLRHERLSSSYESRCKSVDALLEKTSKLADDQAGVLRETRDTALVIRTQLHEVQKRLERVESKLDSR